MELVMGNILLRDFIENDRPAFLAYQSDARYRALGGPQEANPDHAAELFRTFVSWASERSRLNYQLAIVATTDPQAIVGCGGLRGAVRDGKAELGIELAPACWGRHGYAVDAIRALLAFGFDRLGLEEIYGLTTSANLRAERLARWFGATPGPTRPGAAWMRERGWREVEWRIARETWEGMPRRRTAR